jgi:uncharacterized protein YciI
MPFYVYRCYDLPGTTPEYRDSIRPAHREHLQSGAFGVEVLAGGRLMSDDGAHVLGTMIIVRANERDKVVQFAAADPYAQAGIFNRTEIERWDWGIGLPTGVERG